MKRFLPMFVPVLAGLATLTLASAAGANDLIVNGGFEANGGAGSNSFTSWIVSDQAGSSGTWYAQTGAGSPANSFTVPAPPAGSFAAMTDQSGPGAHVLYQDFLVPNSVGAATLSFDRYIQNQNSDFIIGSALDDTVTNQQARVDIMTTTSDPFSIANGDVLLNVFQTNPGDALTSGYTTNSTNVTSLLQNHLGETLRLRIGEADNQGYFNFGVDNVSLSLGAAATPEPGAYALFIASGLAGAGVLTRRRRARRN